MIGWSAQTRRPPHAVISLPLGRKHRSTGAFEARARTCRSTVQPHREDLVQRQVRVAFGQVASDAAKPPRANVRVHPLQKLLRRDAVVVFISRARGLIRLHHCGAAHVGPAVPQTVLDSFPVGPRAVAIEFLRRTHNTHRHRHTHRERERDAHTHTHTGVGMRASNQQESSRDDGWEGRRRRVRDEPESGD